MITARSGQEHNKISIIHTQIHVKRLSQVRHTGHTLGCPSIHPTLKGTIKLYYSHTHTHTHSHTLLCNVNLTETKINPIKSFWFLKLSFQTGLVQNTKTCTDTLMWFVHVCVDVFLCQCCQLTKRLEKKDANWIQMKRERQQFWIEKYYFSDS